MADRRGAVYPAIGRRGMKVGSILGRRSGDSGVWHRTMDRRTGKTVAHYMVTPLGPISTYHRRKEDERRLHPRRLVDCASRGHRLAVFDRRAINGVRHSVLPDASERRRANSMFKFGGKRHYDPKSYISKDRRGTDLNKAGNCQALRYVMHLPMRRKGDERRTGRPLMPKWVASAQAWVPVLAPRRRKGEERRGALSHTRRYSSSTDPRIRALERRKA